MHLVDQYMTNEIETVNLFVDFLVYEQCPVNKTYVIY